MKSRPTAATLFRLQKRVGLVTGAFSIFAALANVYVGIAKRGISAGQVLLDPSVIILAIVGAISLVTTLYNRHWARIIQIGIFFLYAVAGIIFTSSRSLIEVAFIAYALILGIQYQYLKKRFWLKTIIIFIFFGVAEILLKFDGHTFSYVVGFQVIAITGVILYLLWIAFAEELKQYTKENIELKEEIEKNRPFIQFGRNVAEVVHNLKSRFMAIDGFSDLIELESAGQINEYAKMQKDATTLMLQVIDNLLSTVRSYQKVEREPIQLHKMVAGALELLRSNMDFKHNVVVTTEFDEDDKIFASPLEIMQMLDNLIKNAHEAMMSIEAAKLSIVTKHEGGHVLLRVADTGVGIPVCKTCKTRDCLQCSFFQVGNTTKENGTGLGMVFVIELLKEMESGLSVLSVPNRGTTIEIRFPYCEKELKDDSTPPDESAAS